jgi:hypothetical protein
MLVFDKFIVNVICFSFSSGFPAKSLLPMVVEARTPLIRFKKKKTPVITK